MTDLTDERLAEMERGADIPQEPDCFIAEGWQRCARNVLTLITALREERAEVGRLRKWCSAAANDYGKMVELFDRAGFPKSVQECIDTSEFLRDAAEGRADGTIYDDALSNARAEVSRLQDRVIGQLRLLRNCAHFARGAAKKIQPAVTGSNSHRLNGAIIQCSNIADTLDTVIAALEQKEPST